MTSDHAEEQKAPDPKGNRENSLYDFGIWILLAVAGGSTVGVLITGYHNVTKFKELGAWGDFTGGLLNPVLTFITFLAVLLTILLQRKELALTRDEMTRSADALEKQDKTLQRQSFENTFFEMLRLHNSILDSIDLVNPETNQITKGRDAFNVFYNRLAKKYREIDGKKSSKVDQKAIVELTYFLFWRDARTELGHYFRFLFNFFRFLENSEIDDEFYPKLLRSQLSDQELLLLFYNNVSKQGAAFQIYAERYALFDNLSVERLLNHKHANFASAEAYGKNEMDFSPSIDNVPRQ